MNPIAAFFSHPALWQVAQAIGFVGLAFSLAHFQSKSREGMLRLQLVAGLFFSLHFVILGFSGVGLVALSGAIMNFLVALRNWVFGKKRSWGKSNYWLYLFLMLPILAGVLLSWGFGILSALPALAVLIATFARWRDDVALIRYLSLPASALWLFYHIYVGSVPGLILEGLSLVSLILAILRLDLKLIQIKNWHMLK